MSVAQKFVDLVESAYIGGNLKRKREFRDLGMRVMQGLAKRLQLEEGEYSISYNAGGLAVSGDVILQGEELFVSFSQNALGDTFLFRRCDGRRDYGSRYWPNCWMSFSELLDLGVAAQKISKAICLQPESATSLTA